MTKVSGINPHRIEWCCEDYGWTPELLAVETGIPLTTLNRALEGEDALTVSQLQKIAAKFNRGMLFFLEPGPVEAEKVHTPQFRTLANQKTALSPKVKAIVERVERQREIYLGLREELGAEDRIAFDPPELPRKDPKHAAAIAREWLGLGEGNDFQKFRDAVESKGFLVFRTNGYAGPWQIPKDDPIIGFSLYHEICPVIVVKKLPLEARQSFTLMHELGHLLLHRKSFIDEEADLYFPHDKSEREANAFAGHLLVPDEFLARIDDGARPRDAAEYGAWLKEETRAWGVSNQVILIRLMEEGRLSRGEYDDYLEWRREHPTEEERRGNREWRHREPKNMFGDPFVRTVLDALSADRITLNKASAYLDNLKIKDIHALEGFYAGV